MSGPHLVREIGTWRLLRWEYDGAPLQAEHRASRRDPPWTVEIDEAGDLVFDGVPDGTSPMVPRDVLRALIDDAIARGVFKVEAPSG